MSRTFTTDELKRYTLAQLHGLYAELAAQLPASVPGSAERSAIGHALELISREIALPHLSRPGF